MNVCSRNVPRRVRHIFCAHIFVNSHTTLLRPPCYLYLRFFISPSSLYATPLPPLSFSLVLFVLVVCVGNGGGGYHFRRARVRRHSASVRRCRGVLHQTPTGVRSEGTFVLCVVLPSCPRTVFTMHLHIYLYMYFY